MAPEILSGNELKPSADIYSFGCIMLEVRSVAISHLGFTDPQLSRQVLCGQIPWQGKCDTRVICLKVKENKLPDRPACAKLEARHWALMVRCWSRPQKRPTAGELVILVACSLDSTESGVGSTRRFVYVYVFFMVFDHGIHAP